MNKTTPKINNKEKIKEKISQGIKFKPISTWESEEYWTVKIASVEEVNFYA